MEAGKCERDIKLLSVSGTVLIGLPFLS